MLVVDNEAHRDEAGEQQPSLAHSGRLDKVELGELKIFFKHPVSSRALHVALLLSCEGRRHLNELNHFCRSQPLSKWLCNNNVFACQPVHLALVNTTQGTDLAGLQLNSHAHSGLTCTLCMLGQHI